MARQELHRHVEISDHERAVAAAEVTTQGPGGTAWASLRAASGHVTPGRRASLVDAVLDLPEVRESAHLNAVFPLGDGETLQRFQERCLDLRTRPAGDSAIMEANLPSGGSRHWPGRPPRRRTVPNDSGSGLSICGTWASRPEPSVIALRWAGFQAIAHREQRVRE